MFAVQHSVLVHRPVEGVFGYAADRRNARAWQSNTLQVQEEGDRRVREVRNFLGRRFEWTTEMLEHEPNRKIRTRGVGQHKGGAFSVERLSTFESIDGATLVTVRFELNTHGLFKLGKPVFARVLDRELQNSMEHLRDVLEAHPDLHAGLEMFPEHE